MISGAGVGMAWPRLSAWAMGKVDDPAEGPAAAAAIDAVQVICAAFGAALAGVVVNLTDVGDATAARWLLASCAVLAALAVMASTRSGRTRRGGSAAASDHHDPKGVRAEPVWHSRPTRVWLRG